MLLRTVSGHCTRELRRCRRRRFMGHASFCSSVGTCAPRCLLANASARCAKDRRADLRMLYLYDYPTLSTFVLATDKWPHGIAIRSAQSRGARVTRHQPLSTNYTSHTFLAPPRRRRRHRHRSRSPPARVTLDLCSRLHLTGNFTCDHHRRHRPDKPTSYIVVDAVFAVFVVVVVVDDDTCLHAWNFHSCTLSPGYASIHCTLCVAEPLCVQCSDEKDVCPARAQCNRPVGSGRCHTKAGRRENANGLCKIQLTACDPTAHKLLGHRRACNLVRGACERHCECAFTFSLCLTGMLIWQRVAALEL